MSKKQRKTVNIDADQAEYLSSLPEAETERGLSHAIRTALDDWINWRKDTTPRPEIEISKHLQSLTRPQLFAVLKQVVGILENLD